MSQSNGNGHANGQWAQLPLDPTLEAEKLEFGLGSTVYEADSEARRIYFIHSGQVRTYEAGPDETARLLEILGPGDWFGEASLAELDVHASRAVAESDVSNT